MKINTSLQIIDEICKEKNINVTMLSYGWIRKLEKNNKNVYIVGNKFDLNPSGCMDIVNDKYATYEVLKNNNIPSLEYKIIFNPKSRYEYMQNYEQELRKIFKEYNNKIVIKLNNSSSGEDVYLFENVEDAISKVKYFFEEEKENNVNICPFENIECEYRAIYLDGEILYVYKKIPKKGEWKHNLSNGAIPLEVTELDLDRSFVLDIARRAGKAVNARFVTVDISKTYDKKIFVMEINGSVCMSKFAETFPNGREITKDIYEKAIISMI